MNTMFHHRKFDVVFLVKIDAIMRPSDRPNPASGVGRKKKGGTKEMDGNGKVVSWHSFVALWRMFFVCMLWRLFLLKCAHCCIVLVQSSRCFSQIVTVSFLSSYHHHYEGERLF